MSIDEFIRLVKENKIDAVHPGYGFLSESADFARRMWDEAKCIVIGPGAEVLERTGDKLKAKMLAEECMLMCLPMPIKISRFIDRRRSNIKSADNADQ